MIDGSEKRNRQLAFELQNSHVCEKRCKVTSHIRIRKTKISIRKEAEVKIHRNRK